MPGSGRCARCGASLSFASLEIDVNPPRASNFERRLPVRPLVILRRASESLHIGITSLVGPMETTNFGGSVREVLSLAIPGLPQFRAGDRDRGKVLFYVFLGLLFLTVVFAGTGPGSVFLGLLFSSHVVSAVDALVRNFSRLADRIGFTMLIALGLLTLLYMPTMWLCYRVATPLRITQTNRYFGAGQVVWYNRGASADVGDLVLYELPSVTANARPGTTFYNTQYNLMGLRINRLVAVAGQTVQFDGVQLLVDGERSPWQPATLGVLPAGKDFVVRPDTVFILPENVVPANIQAANPSLFANFDERLAIVPVANLRGQVFFRSYPPIRLHFY